MTAVTVIGSLGGLTAFVTAVFLLIRAIFRQIDATKENTVSNNTLATKLENLSTRVDQHEIDIAVLKDRVGR